MAVRIAADSEPIPGYRLIERLGRGGFGEVWKASAPGGMLKAIKFVYGDLDEATEDGKPAEQELKALNRVKSIRHPYILSLERFDILDGQLLIVMELADRNLFDRFRECQQQALPGIPRAELIGYMEESAEALDLMNTQFQLQHLDIKPQNLFLVFNHIKVADFGLAKDMEGMQATLTGGVTPVYAAPETFECKVTRFCDQYSLAIVFQELLTGQRPFNGTTARQLMMQHIHSEPDLTPLQPADRAIVGRALMKIPEKRYPFCADFIHDLKEAGRALVTVAVAAAPPASQADMALPAIRSTTNGQVAPSPSSPPGSGEFAGLSGISLKTSPVGVPAGHERVKLPSLTAARQAAAAAILANVPPAPPEQTGPGALVPGMIIGVGEMGAIVLQRLRRTLRDRFGTAALPHLRFLFIDTDPNTVQAAAATNPLDAAELFLARLNRPAHYGKARDDLPNVRSWLNPQMIFRIPRQPSTGGIRAFGRLAFCDHYRALMQKIRVDLEAVLAPDTLAAADQLTHLGLRSSWPRVHIVASMVGGTGSGMFLDLAYAVRFQLKLLGYKQPEVNGVVYVPHVDHTTPKTPTVANAYAALTEMFHYTSPNTTYEATFDAKVGPIIDRERPFTRCLILPLPKTVEPTKTRMSLGLGAGFLYQEMLTPFGRHADKARSGLTKPVGLPSFFQTCGTFRLTWPRRTLLEKSAIRCYDLILKTWSDPEVPHLVEPIRQWLDEQWTARQLGTEHLVDRFRDACHQFQNRDPVQLFDALIDPLEDKKRYPKLGTADVCGALDRILHLVGPPEDPSKSTDSGKLGQVLEQSCRTLGRDGEKKLAELAVALIDMPGYRLSGADELIRQMTDRLRASLDSFEPVLPSLQRECDEIYSRLMAQIAALDGTIRGSRRATLVCETLANVRQYARKRLEFMQARALVQVYRSMLNYAPEFAREIQFCRKTLERVQSAISDARAWQDKHGYLGPCKAILPAGTRNLDDAADQIVANVTPEEVFALETRIQAQIRKQYKSLVQFCMEKTDQSKGMTELILEQMRAFFDERLGSANAATVFFESQLQEQAAHRYMMEAYDEAMPELTGGHNRADSQMCLVTVPDGESGARFGRIAEQTLAQSQLSLGAGTEDIVIHREQLYLSPSDLPQLGPVAREAFIQVGHQDQAVPHSRADVTWLQVGKET